MPFRKHIAPLLALLAAFSSASGMAQETHGLRFNALLSGAQVIPAVDARLAALARVTFDAGLTEARLSFETTSGLRATGAQLHCGLPGEDGPVVASLLNPGPLSDLRDGAGVTLRQVAFQGSGCEFQIGRPVSNVAALAFAMREGLVYITLATREFPQGELRGQFLSVAETGELELPDDRLSAPFPR